MYNLIPSLAEFSGGWQRYSIVSLPKEKLYQGESIGILLVLFLFYSKSYCLPKVSISNVRSSRKCQLGDQGSYIDRAESGRNHFRGGIRHSQMGLREERMVS